MRYIPLSVHLAIAEAIRLGPGPSAPALEQLAWIYGEGSRIVMRACDAALPPRKSLMQRLGWRA